MTNLLEERLCGLPKCGPATLGSHELTWTEKAKEPSSRPRKAVILGVEAREQQRVQRVVHVFLSLVGVVISAEVPDSSFSPFATRNKCIASSNKCLTSSNKKLLETSALLTPPDGSHARQVLPETPKSSSRAGRKARPVDGEVVSGSLCQRTHLFGR